MADILPEQPGDAQRAEVADRIAQMDATLRTLEAQGIDVAPLKARLAHAAAHLARGEAAAANEICAETEAPLARAAGRPISGRQRVQTGTWRTGRASAPAALPAEVAPFGGDIARGLRDLIAGGQLQRLLAEAGAATQVQVAAQIAELRQQLPNQAAQAAAVYVLSEIGNRIRTMGDEQRAALHASRDAIRAELEQRIDSGLREALDAVAAADQRGGGALAALDQRLTALCEGLSAGLDRAAVRLESLPDPAAWRGELLAEVDRRLEAVRSAAEAAAPAVESLRQEVMHVLDVRLGGFEPGETARLRQEVMARVDGLADGMRAIAARQDADAAGADAAIAAVRGELAAAAAAAAERFAADGAIREERAAAALAGFDQAIASLRSQLAAQQAELAAQAAARAQAEAAQAAAIADAQRRLDALPDPGEMRSELIAAVGEVRRQVESAVPAAVAGLRQEVIQRIDARLTGFDPAATDRLRQELITRIELLTTGMEQSGQRRVSDAAVLAQRIAELDERRAADGARGDAVAAAHAAALAQLRDEVAAAATRAAERFAALDAGIEGRIAAATAAFDADLARMREIAAAWGDPAAFQAGLLAEVAAKVEAGRAAAAAAVPAAAAELRQQLLRELDARLARFDPQEAARLRHELTTRIELLTVGIEDAEHHLAAGDAALDQRIEATAAAHDGAIAALRDELRAATAAATERFAAIDAALDQRLSAATAAFDAAVADLRAELTAAQDEAGQLIAAGDAAIDMRLSAAIAGYDAAMADLRAGLGDAAAAHQATAARIDELTAMQKSVWEGMRAEDDRLAAGLAGLRELVAALPDQSAILDAVERRIAAAAAAADEVQRTWTAACDARLGQADAGQAMLARRVEDIVAEGGRLQSRLAELGDEMRRIAERAEAVPADAGERAAEAASRAVGELRGELAAGIAREVDARLSPVVGEAVERALAERMPAGLRDQAQAAAESVLAERLPAVVERALSERIGSRDELIAEIIARLPAAAGPPGEASSGRRLEADIEWQLEKTAAERGWCSLSDVEAVVARAVREMQPGAGQPPSFARLEAALGEFVRQTIQQQQQFITALQSRFERGTQILLRQAAGPARQAALRRAAPAAGDASSAILPAAEAPASGLPAAEAPASGPAPADAVDADAVTAAAAALAGGSSSGPRDIAISGLTEALSATHLSSVTRIAGSVITAAIAGVSTAEAEPAEAPPGTDALHRTGAEPPVPAATPAAPDEERIRQMVHAEFDRRLGQVTAARAAARAAAPAASGDDELRRSLIRLLPEVLGQPEVAHRLFALIAKEAVTQPGALGELTGLRQFLRDELAVAGGLHREAAPA